MTAIHVNVEVVETLIDAGASLTPDASSSTAPRPLKYAIHRGNVEVIQALLDAGASLEAEDLSSPTPLQVAVLAGNVEVI